MKDIERRGTAINKIKGQLKWVIDENSIMDDGGEVPEHIIGKIIETNRFISSNKPNKIKVVRHYLLPYNKETQTQRCGLCGEIIHNYNNVMYSHNSDGSPHIENGWTSGVHYVEGINPTLFTSTLPDKDKYNIVLCNVINDKNK